MLVLYVSFYHFNPNFLISICHKWICKATSQSKNNCTTLRTMRIVLMNGNISLIKLGTHFALSLHVLLVVVVVVGVVVVVVVVVEVEVEVDVLVEVDVEVEVVVVVVESSVSEFWQSKSNAKLSSQMAFIEERAIMLFNILKSDIQNFKRCLYK